MKTLKHESRTRWVVILTALTMVVEIIFGIFTNSMALLADGIHMGSHVFALGLSWVAYVIVRNIEKRPNQPYLSKKIFALSGYTSGLILMLFAIVIFVEAIQRFFNPTQIAYTEAILVATIGLAVNVFSAYLLHHKTSESDHNIKAAYLHVLADALTSISAIIGLLVAKYFHFPLIDPIVAIISSLVIIKWSVGLLKQTGSELIMKEQNF